MEPPGRCGDWLAPPPSPPRAHAPGRHDEQGVRTFRWPPAGTYTWPSTRTFPWPLTRRCPRRVGRSPGCPEGRHADDLHEGGDVALQTTDYRPLAQALGGASGDVGASAVVESHPGEDDGV